MKNQTVLALAIGAVLSLGNGACAGLGGGRPETQSAEPSLQSCAVEKKKFPRIEGRAFYHLRKKSECERERDTKCETRWMGLCKR
ncbi:MAG: hypothetical protein AB1405_17095 [Bdellovibrionota bacterium]